jgi:hypothetical protein
MGASFIYMLLCNLYPLVLLCCMMAPPRDGWMDGVEWVGFLLLTRGYHNDNSKLHFHAIVEWHT